MPDYSVQRFRKGWAVVWRDADGKRHRHALVAPDRLGAEAEARKRWALGDRSPWTVGRIVPAYIASREADGIASTARQRDAWKAMKPLWENVAPHLIDTAMCKAYAAQRARAPATVRYELGMLSVALRWAEDAKHIAKAPAIWRPEPPERRERHLTRNQFARFLSAMKAPHAKLYAVLGVETLARPSAILELTWDRVDFERGLIRLNPFGRTQTAKRRPTLPISDRLRPYLERAFAARQSAYVVERGGKKVASIKKAFEAASARSGIKATPYTLRHSGAIWKAEDGLPMAELAQFMGHDDDRTTQRHYARYSPEYLRTAANAGGWTEVQGSW